MSYNSPVLCWRRPCRTRCTEHRHHRYGFCSRTKLLAHHYSIHSRVRYLRRENVVCSLMYVINKFFFFFVLNWARRVAPNSPDLNPADYAIWGSCGSDSNTLLSNEAGDRGGVNWRALPQHLIDQKRRWIETSSAVCRGSECRTHWTRVLLDTARWWT